MEEVVKNLTDVLAVVVGWCARDGGEIDRGIGKEVLGLLSCCHIFGRVKKGGWRRDMEGRAEPWLRWKTRAQRRRALAGKLRIKLSTYAEEHH